jgi:hypothetical protein
MGNGASVPKNLLQKLIPTLFFTSSLSESSIILTKRNFFSGQIGQRANCPKLFHLVIKYLPVPLYARQKSLAN